MSTPPGQPDRNRLLLESRDPTRSVTACEPTEGDEGASLTSSAYRITVDGGRDSFYALCIEEPTRETAWLMSDTVRSLDELR